MDIRMYDCVTSMSSTVYFSVSDTVPDDNLQGRRGLPSVDVMSWTSVNRILQ